MNLKLYYELNTSFVPTVTNCSWIDMTAKYILVESHKTFH